MKNDELIGQVGAEYLRACLRESNDDSTARYLLDCLTAEQTVAIANAVSSDSQLANITEIKLPRHFVGHLGLPDFFLTNERTTYYRNAFCNKPVLLITNTGDDEEQSLKELEPIGRAQLLANMETWVFIGSKGLVLVDEHKKWWVKALLGLMDVKNFSLDHLAGYVLATRAELMEGQTILDALGKALPELRIPRDSKYFSNNLDKKTAGHRGKWRKLYDTVIKRRACYLLKQSPTQNILTVENLRESYNRVLETEKIPVNLHGCIEEFINAPGDWNNEARRFAECEWEWVRYIFEELKKEKSNLGKETLDFFEDKGDDLLTESERDYLQRFKKKQRNDFIEEDEEFYENHRVELRENSSLKTKWDNFIIGRPEEADDFLVGLVLCLEPLFDRNLSKCKRRLKIRCDKKTKGELKQLNCDAGLYFAFRYKGLKILFGDKIEWDIGYLFQFESLYKEWKSQCANRLNNSNAKAALQLKFHITLEVEMPRGNTETYKKQLVWTFKINSIPASLISDWERLEKSPLLRCIAHIESVSVKGFNQSINLLDAKTLRPAYYRDRGSFIGKYKKESDIANLWPENLTSSHRQNSIDQETYDQLSVLFEKFKSSYSRAIHDFKNEGIGCHSLLEQVQEYHVLLEAICNKARGDRNRENLLRPILEIGAVQIEGGDIMTIVVPWHPLRLAAMATMARQISTLIQRLLIEDDIHFGDTRLFFKELKDEYTHPFYPEIVLGWKDTKPAILSLSDSFLDYSLHELPVAGDYGFDETNESPSDGAALVIHTLKRFLSLYPHEKANMSLVLYNSDSAHLPRAIIEKISQLKDDEEEICCQIILRHRDNTKLREIYERIVEADDDPDSFISSEASKDFMARLRIGIMANQAPIPDPKDGPPVDLVFLQDVIARKAKLEWYPVDATPMNPTTFVPWRWSRKRPSAYDEMKSVIFLCSPVQTREGWSFITALTSFFKEEWHGDPGKKLLPARQLDFNDPETRSIFKEIHNLGNWVVNYDELLDRRQLLNQDVRVIRYKQRSTQGRNILISSTAQVGLLQAMVQDRIRSLVKDITDKECQDLANRFWSDASEISGEIILRAARRGRNASELMGIVLSRFLIRQELNNRNYFGWYFLDDYAEWLGQREEQIADILTLVPHCSNEGKMRLDVVICESKYISRQNLSSKRRESQKQLFDTVQRIHDALFGNPKRLDRDLWLSRFSDLVLTGIQVPVGASIDLEKWRRAIREGDCEIFLRGYSHIFVYDSDGSADCSDFIKVANLENSYQEVFSRENVSNLVKHYWQKTDPTSLRIENAGTNTWCEVIYKPTEERLSIGIVNNEQTNKSINGREPMAGESERLVKGVEGVAVEDREEFAIPENGPLGTVEKNPGWTFSGVGDIISHYHSENKDSVMEQEWLKSIGNDCKLALQQFQLKSKLLESVLTPNAALLKFQGSSNLTVEQVLKKRSEFLTTHMLQVISVKGEPGVVAISIARPTRRVLHLLDVWKDWKPECKNGNNELLIGLREEDSTPLFLSPKRHSPHTLIAGTTGSGKSILMQNIILGIACTNTVEQSRITLIDPKCGVDYFAFEELPHLYRGVIDNQQLAIATLLELVEEMDKRYELLRKNRVSNIYDLNNKVDATVHLPYLWIIHDEFAEWMMSSEYAENVANVVARLGVKARAAGIFLVFAAQRPDKDVVPMQLRANLGNRLILRVDSEGTSEIALGEKGAERLLGKGHIAVKLEGEEGIITAQVPFISTKEIEDIVLEIRLMKIDGKGA